MLDSFSAAGSSWCTTWLAGHFLLIQMPTPAATNMKMNVVIDSPIATPKPGSCQAQRKPLNGGGGGDEGGGAGGGGLGGKLMASYWQTQTAAVQSAGLLHVVESGTRDEFSHHACDSAALQPGVLRHATDEPGEAASQLVAQSAYELSSATCP